MKRLEGRVALITGAGAGIGRAVAGALAREGAVVIVSDINGENAAIVAGELSVAGHNAIALAADVTKPADVAAMLAQIDALHGRLDILVNNAGLNVRADFRHLSDLDWRTIRETNLDSVVRLSRDAFPLLRVSGAGVILNLASIMATRHLRQLAAYSATKGAVAALSRSLAVEYGAFGIRVNYLCPGFIETALTDRVLRHPPMRKALLDQTPLRRFGSTDDVAKAALFLVSDDAAFITGSGLNVDGGMAIGL